MSSPDPLVLLKSHGASPTKALAKQLGVSRQAVRARLERLAGEGLVQHATVREGVGRPKKMWSLTDKGHRRFPDSHAEITAELIAAVRAEFGEEGLDRLIGRRERAVAQTYRAFMARSAGLEDKLDRLVRLRTAEGYMAEWSKSEDGGYLFVENHCPICVAATACRSFCRSELNVFKALLAPAQVRRTDHIIAGARRCAYAVTPAD
jgi:predicted ArsR family transcriptional regulator